MGRWYIKGWARAELSVQDGGEPRGLGAERRSKRDLSEDTYLQRVRVEHTEMLMFSESV